MTLCVCLQGAIKAAYTIKCFKSSAGFCRKILELAVSSNQSSITELVNPKQIKGILKLSERENTEAHDLAYDDSVVCVSVLGERKECSLCVFSRSFKDVS